MIFIGNFVLEGILNALPVFFIFHFGICPAWQMEASISFVSMGSNLSILGVVLILDLDLFFPVLYHVPICHGGEVPCSFSFGWGL